MNTYCHHHHHHTSHHHGHERSDCGSGDHHHRHHHHAHHHNESGCDCKEHGHVKYNCCDTESSGHCCDTDHGRRGYRIQRHFASPEEQRALLKEYVDQLKKELAGAEAALKQLSNSDD